MTTDTAPDLSGLIERLEKGSGGDRIIDDEIEWAFSEWENMGGFWRRHKVTGQQERFNYSPSPPVTSSLDAALAFAEALDVPWPVVLTAAMKKRRDDDLARLPRAVLAQTLYHVLLRPHNKDTTDD